jgi:hypothetical protein
MKCCPTCGHPVTVADELKLTGNKKLIYNFVHRAGQHGIDSNRLYELVYSGAVDGGPFRNTLAVQINQLNKKLKPFGQFVQGGRSGRGVPGTYRLRVVA